MIFTKQCVCNENQTDQKRALKLCKYCVRPIDVLCSFCSGLLAFSVSIIVFLRSISAIKSQHSIAFSWLLCAFLYFIYGSYVDFASMCTVWRVCECVHILLLDICRSIEIFNRRRRRRRRCFFLCYCFVFQVQT